MEAKELERLIEMKEQFILCLCDEIKRQMEQMEEMKVMLNDKLREG
jgi:hypothetical protein